MKKNLNEQISRIKNMMGLNEGDYDRMGNYMGGNPPEWENEVDPMEVNVEPDQYLKNEFGEDIDVKVVDTDFDSGVSMGEKYRSVTFTLVYNGGEELPEELYSALDSHYNSVEPDEHTDDDGNTMMVYKVKESESTSGPEPSDY